MFSAADNREMNATASGRYTEYAWGGSSAGSGGNAVGNHPHRETTDKHGAVGHFATDI